MFYPKIVTLFELLPINKQGTKWDCSTGKLLPSTAPLHFLPMEELIFTEKIDGTNMGIHIVDGEIKEILGKNNSFQEGDKNGRFHTELANSLIPKLNKAKGIEPLVNVIFFGELAGVKIQKGGNYFNERKFLVFDIYDVNNSVFFMWPAVNHFCQLLGLDMVPEIVYPYNSLSHDNVKAFLENQKSVFNPNYSAEGFIVRHNKDRHVERRWIAKIRRKDFNLR